MKKILLIAAVAMTAFFTSCTKNDPSASLADKLCSMYNQPVDQALETVKSLGFTAIDSRGNFYLCLKNASDITNYMSLLFDDKNENRVTGLMYNISSTPSDILAQAKSLVEQTGESRVINNVTTKFDEGEVDEVDTKSYSEFLQKVGNTTDNAEASWEGSVPQPVINFNVDIDDESASVSYQIGELGD